ncbi:MAG TPA: hypothetical protein PLO23_00340 [Alphaproteobacteria bacterium]|nr:hypothetical protein [Alphaproteobacteria bacterium]
MKSKLLLTTLSVLALSAPAYAEEGHDHANEKSHAHESSEAHSDGHGHDEKPHFAVAKPANVEAAWTLLDDTIVSSRKAIEANDSNALHESGEKLVAAVQALHDFSDTENTRVKQALEQLSKTADRFHHAAEDNDKAGAGESLELIVTQKDIVKSLYEQNTGETP